MLMSTSGSATTDLQNTIVTQKMKPNKYNFLNNSLKQWHEEYMISLKQNAF